jgi:hypothetical protein
MAHDEWRAHQSHLPGRSRQENVVMIQATERTGRMGPGLGDHPDNTMFTLEGCECLPEDSPAKGPVISYRDGAIRLYHQRIPRDLPGQQDNRLQARSARQCAVVNLAPA